MMKKIRMLLLAAAALMPLGAADEPRHSVPETEEYQPSERERRLYHNELNAILAFVHNRATADAAAPRIRALMGTPQLKDAEPHLEIWMELYFGHNCFGSSALLEALQAIQPNDFKTAEPLRVALSPFMDELDETLFALAEIVAGVRDEASEARAIAALKAFPAFFLDWQGRMMTSLAEKPMCETDGWILLAIQGIRPLPQADNLLHAYVSVLHQQPRPALTAAMERAWKPLRKLTHTPFFAELTVSELSLRAAQVRALHEFVDIAAGIHDKESADAAADWARQKRQELGFPLLELGMSMGRGRCVCHNSLTLGISLRAIIGYFVHAEPAYYGSEKLKALLTEEH